jgi:hypothetical protein
MIWRLLMVSFLFANISIANNLEVFIRSNQELTKTTFCQKVKCQFVQTVLPPEGFGYFSIGNSKHIVISTIMKKKINISLSYNIEVLLPQEKNVEQLEIMREFVVLATGMSLEQMGFERACLQMVRPELLGMTPPDFGSYSDRGLAGIYRVLRKQTQAGWIRVMCGTYLGNGPGWTGIAIDAIDSPKKP